MALFSPRKKRRAPTRSDYHALLFIRWLPVIVGPFFILHSVYADHRDRPSLSWPKVSGVIMQCDQTYHNRKNSYYTVEVSYSYLVNGSRYVGRQITLWNPDLHSSGERVQTFMSAHPVRSVVDVYHDPAHPENAVLIPGPDETDNRLFFWGGVIVFAGGVFLVISLRSRLADLKIKITAAESRPHAAVPAAFASAYASYEPANKRKLNVYPDKECLFEVLGHDGAPLQQWEPEDRIIDTAGREYRLLKLPGKKFYDLEATGSTWTYERLLDVALADTRSIKKDPDKLRRELSEVPAEKRMAALMKSMDEMPFAPRLFIAGFILCLILFFLAVLFTVGKLLLWLQSNGTIK